MSAAPSPPPRRFKKRVVVPSAILLVLAVLSGWIYVRGTWASEETTDPATSSEGVVRQLHLRPDGAKVVRSAVVVDRPVAEVWRVVTDYESFDELFGRLESIECRPREGGDVDLSGVARIPAGRTFAFESTIHHEESADRRVASWDSPGGDLAVNRGSWTLTPLGGDRTLVVWTLEVEVRRVPTFLVRVAMLHESKRILRAMAARAAR